MQNTVQNSQLQSAVYSSVLSRFSFPIYKFIWFSRKLLAVFAVFFSIMNVFGQTTNTFVTPGAGSWVAPVGVTAITVEVWGAGGAGTGVGVLADNGLNSAGGGGSGGGFVKTTYAVTAGTTYNFNVGSGGLGTLGSEGGDSWFIDASTIKAIGGKGAGTKISSDNTSGAGAIAPITGNIGGSLISTYGGNGGNGLTASFAGGGGSSAGNTGGNSASGATGGLAPANGYDGATSPSGNGAVGNIGGIGAGGSGAKKGGEALTPEGGNGGDGQLKITYTCPVYSAGTNQTLATCSTTATLAATPVSLPATGVWTVVSGSGSITAPTSPTSEVTGIVPGTALVLRWTVSNGSCGSSFSEVTITSPPLLVTNAATAAVCSGTSPNISLTASVPSSFTWTVGTVTGSISGANAGSGSTINQILTNPSNTVAGTIQYIVTPTATSGGCVGSPFTITVTVNPTPEAITVSGGGTFCTGATITALGGSGGTVYYQGTVSGGTSTATPSTSQTVTKSGTYYFRSRSAAGCWGIQGSVAVTVNLSAGSPSSSPTLCVNTPLSPNITITTTGATGIGTPAGLPTGVNASWAADKITISGTPTTIGIFNYSIPLTGGCGSVNATGTMTVTGPSSTSTALYISNVQFLGTLNADTGNPSFYTSPGYADYTGLAAVAKQIPGGVINVNVNLTATSGTALAVTKAWVDWNKDGAYNDNASEQVYDLGSLQSENVIFGYVIPVGTAPGIYTIRIRSNTGTSSFGPCGNLPNGETEDYSFEIITDCSAKILSANATKQCGSGPVTLTAEATAGSSYRWYDTAFGSVPIAGETGDTYTTPSLNVGEQKTYYVTAFDGVCESSYRTPIKINLRPSPLISFTTSSPEFCGDLNQVIISSSADKEQVALLEDHFENTVDKPLKFKNVSEGDPTADGQWTIQMSPYVPASPHIFRPALSSGYNGGQFANIITDIRYSAPLLNSLELIDPLNSTGFTNLKLDFDFYYFSEEDAPARNNLKVQYSIVPGVWKDFAGQTYFIDQGSPSSFKSVTVDLPVECQNITDLKVRFLLSTFGAANEWIANIVAIDNVRLYGDRDLPAKFTWSGQAGIIYSSADCAGSPDPLGSPSVCIKLSDAEMKSKSQFTITATAALANGCTSVGNFVIKNNTKIWDAAATTDWNTANWQPADSKIPPIADKCVVIRKPVVLGLGNQGFAKNVKVEGEGKLTIQPDQSLTVTDAFINNVLAQDVVIESDAGLIQLNEGNTINTGNITAKRTIELSAGRQQYNYLISPLEGQFLKSVYPGIDFVLYHNEGNNFFYSSSGAYIKGRALAVKEPNKTAVPTGVTVVSATFTGYPTNGTFTYNIVNSNPSNASRGYNLVGNPYPSNIDLIKFYNLNSITPNTLSPTIHFWDNEANSQTVQMGDLYGSQAYAVFNAVTPPGEGTGTRAAKGDSPLVGAKVPTQYVKMGQGFMVKTSVPVQALIFNNTIRTKEGGDAFFGKNNGKSSEIDRYWLNMITPENLNSNIAVVYFEGGNNGISKDDSPALGGSDELFSMVDNEKMVINGRSKFSNEDVVPLGTRHFAAGQYRIELDNTEGIFTNGQNIYVKDKQTGILTNLTEGSYSFAATAGESTGRFEIAYKPEAVLTTGARVKENLVVYRDGSDFIVKAPNKKITRLEVFDGAGRLMRTLTPNSLKAVVPMDQMLNGVYVLKINQNGEITTKKIIR